MARKRRRGLVVTGIVLAVALAGAAAADYRAGFDAETRWLHSQSAQAADLQAAIARADSKFTPESTRGWDSDPVLNDPVLADARTWWMDQKVASLEHPYQLPVLFGIGYPLTAVSAQGERDALQPLAASVQRSKAQAAVRSKADQAYARLVACGRNAGIHTAEAAALSVQVMSISDRYPRGADDALVAQVLAEARKFCAPAK